MKTYADYYAHTLADHINGLKWVGGGTGLGKTSGIQEWLAKPLPDGRKAIYVANRLQLLKEMQVAFHPSKGVIMLPRDFEVVQQTLTNFRDAFDEFVESSTFTGNTEGVDLAKLRQTRRTLYDILQSTGSSSLPYWQQETAERYATMLLWDFRTVVKNLKRKSPKAHKHLLDHPVIQSLFPYVAFKQRPDARLLLVSLQKMFYGFFDGEKTVNGTHLKGYVIFADEFDFLENDLVRLIVRSPQIDDPFDFVERFYREMSRHKLLLENYPVSSSNDTGRRLREITCEIKKLQVAGINYPDINEFINSQAPEDVAVFRTSHTVSSKPIYLCQAERAFDIVFSPAQCTGQPVFRATRLLTPVSAISERILTLLKALEIDDSVTYEGVVRDCFRNTTFPEQIARVAQFPRPRGDQDTRIGSLLDSGYSMFDIHYPANPTDPQEVTLRHHTIYITPEKFIATLATNNLVFALSATADIHRCVNHFNMAWLNHQADVHVLPLDEGDRAIIAARSAEKSKVRQNQVEVVRLPTLDQYPSVGKDLKTFIGTISRLDGFGEDHTQQGYLKQRVERFFASLLWASTLPPLEDEVQTHLVFLNTYRQVQFLFTADGLQDNDFYHVRVLESEHLFTAYELDFAGHTFYVVFYNAEQAKRIRNHQQAEVAFNALFHQELPVVVVTQYLSAGNGVNLQYTLADGRKRDFINLHLLEVPYYYFNPPNEDDTAEDATAKLKENLWYLSKLHAEKYLSEREFKSKLGTLHKPYDWNNMYQQHRRMYADYQLNTLSALIQALGRIERVWNPMPDQRVVMCMEAYHTFQQYLSETFEGIREARDGLNSSNLQQVLEQVEAQIPQQQRAIRHQRDSRIRKTNAECKQAVQTLLNQFLCVRQGQDTQQVEWTWRHLREAALKHDFADETLQQYHAVFTSRHIQRASVCFTPEMDAIPHTLMQPDSYLWHMNRVYDVIRNNEVIQDYFAQRGYEMDFSLDEQQGFVPYFQQSILAGAIGEEAITALLVLHDIGVEPPPSPLFEVADLKVIGHPCYIDCKNYSDATLERFALTSDDDAFYVKFTDAYFRERAMEKWQQIALLEGEHSRLIYINLATAHERPLILFQGTDQGLQEVDHFSQAHIIVVQGALQAHQPSQFHIAFEHFLTQLKETL